MKTKRAAIILLSWIVLSSFAEGEKQNMTDIEEDKFVMQNIDKFRTPEAAAFLRYGSHGVDEYTGHASISIPLYTIIVNDVSIPLTLTYDATGIKVEQDASWVGLGWNLMVGGIVNFITAGAIDLDKGQRELSDSVWINYLTSIPPSSSSLHDSIRNMEHWMEMVPEDRVFGVYTEDFDNKWRYGFFSDIASGIGETDFYSGNFLGKSFYFMVDPFTSNIVSNDGIQIGRSEEKYKIVKRPNEIEITDGYGYRGYFSDGDHITTGSKVYTSSYKISRIESPRGENIDFLYSPERCEWQKKVRHEEYNRVTTTGHQDKINCYPNANTHFSKVSGSSTVSTSYLEKIQTSNQTICFYTSSCNSRNGDKLDSVIVLAKPSKKIIKKIVLKYGEFDYSTVGGSYTEWNDKRLKLEAVLDVSDNDTLITELDYNNLLLPSKSSCAQDFWGYYNGRENRCQKSGGNTLLPNPVSFLSPTLISDYSINFSGADRYCYPDYLQAAILRKITYPTGGFTTYSFESNRFLSKFMTQKEDTAPSPRIINVYNTYDPYGGENKAEMRKPMHLDQKSALKLKYGAQGMSCYDSMRVSLTIVSYQDPTVNPTRVFTCLMNENARYQEVEIIADSGNYEMIISAPKTITGAGYNCYAIAEVRNFDGQLFESLGGGLRIRQIDNYTDEGIRTQSQIYKYEDEEGRSTGKLLMRQYALDSKQITYIDNLGMYSGLEGIHRGYDGPCYYTLEVLKLTTGRSILPVFYSACCPGIVGYSAVTKEIYDSEMNLIKKIKTKYMNQSPKNYGNLMEYFDYLDNGNVLEQNIYNSNDTLEQRVIHDYNRKNTYFSCNMITEDRYIDNADACVSNDYTGKYAQMGSRFLICRYPYILSRSELKESETIEYVNGKPAQSTQTEYWYDSTNLQISKIRETMGGASKIIEYQYASSSGSNPMATQYHILNLPIQKKIFIEDSLLVTQRNCYGRVKKYFDYGTESSYECYMPLSVQYSQAGNLLEERISYRYDKMLNVQEVIKDKTNFSVYIWSYNGLYPMAKIDGIPFEKVQKALGSSYLESLLRKDIPDESDYSKIRMSIKSIGGMVTTAKYEPLLGITSLTSPTGVTTSFKYDSYGRLKQTIDVRGNQITGHEYNNRNVK